MWQEKQQQGFYQHQQHDLQQQQIQQSLHHLPPRPPQPSYPLLHSDQTDAQGVPYPEGYVPPVKGKKDKKKKSSTTTTTTTTTPSFSTPFGSYASSSISSSASTAAGLSKPYGGIQKTTTGGDGSSSGKKKKKKILRVAGGEVWEDPTLQEWDSSDFRLFCGDIGNEVTDDTLMRAFSKYQSLQKVHVVRDKKTLKSKGYGFLSFKDPDDYVKAMREMNGKYVGNRPIKLRKSTWDERNADPRSIRKTLVGGVVKKD